ncbi:hypothetical protein C2G38_2195790 [Gigaspora rosea]|uniref:Uncharacterized protein n=1 Tax=Gigaspora rosea TaxID=44941 RepID=A0A397V4G1_9GLOM|nr:hypothetical protein C2G38_2195790 [Gigaspora rosea]
MRSSEKKFLEGIDSVVGFLKLGGAILLADGEDRRLISQEGYQQIAVVNSTIPREGAISNKRVLLNKQIEANIRIMQVNLYHLEVENDSTDAFKQGMIDKIDKIGAQRSSSRTKFLVHTKRKLKQDSIKMSGNKAVYNKKIKKAKTSVIEEEDLNAIWRTCCSNKENEELFQTVVKDLGDMVE